MRKPIISIILLLNFLPITIFGQVVQEYKLMDANRIKTPFINTGIFNQNIEQVNYPGFEWPKNNPAGACLIFTTGLTIAAKINGQIRMAAASYEGEYVPGYILNGVAMTDSRFHIYKIYRTDNANNNPDYANWGEMVPYGAPYVDVNFNSNYDPGIDTPGVHGASETIFICLTDGFPGSHSKSEGFAGGTAPLMAEVHFTTWSYNISGLEDANFMKWDIINKSGATWNGAIFSIISDPDIGDATDDWIGCDTVLDMGYAYNGDNDDGGGGPGTYGTNPPAVGISFLKTPKKISGEEFGMTSFVRFGGGGLPFCERFPDNAQEAYNYMKGLKSNGNNWLNPTFSPPIPTLRIFPGHPEGGQGWTESDGSIANCYTLSDTITPNPPGDRRTGMSTWVIHYLIVSNNQSITIVASQLAAKR